MNGLLMTVYSDEWSACNSVIIKGEKGYISESVHGGMFLHVPITSYVTA